MPAILKAENLTKTYSANGKPLTVLHEVNFEVPEGGTMSIVGPSGSGKSTLLGLCAGLDKPSSGNVILNGIGLAGLSEDALAKVRNQHIGFIFQNFQLLPTLTALENVMVPMELQGQKNVRPKALELLGKVGLGDRHHHYPVQLSGGEQQRVALARAFANTPKILFADEPTGNLDDDTSARITDLIFTLNQEAGTTLIIVTHDPELAAKTQQVIRLKGGHVVTMAHSV